MLKPISTEIYFLLGKPSMASTPHLFSKISWSYLSNFTVFQKSFLYSLVPIQNLFTLDDGPKWDLSSQSQDGDKSPQMHSPQDQNRRWQKPGPPNTSDVQNAGQECKITFAPSTQPQQCYSISKPDNLKLFGKNPRWSNEDFSNHVTPNPIGWSRIWPLVGLPDYHDCWVPFWYYRCFVLFCWYAFCLCVSCLCVCCWCVVFWYVSQARLQHILGTYFPFV